MGMNVAAVGYGYPAGELPQERLPTGQQRGRVPEALQATAPDETPLQEKKSVVNLTQTTADLEKISLAFNKKLRFEVNRELEEVIVKVIDPATDKVIKELPPEELQRLHLKIREMIGLLFDERV